MRSGIWFLIFLFFTLSAPLYASGRHDESEIKTQNDEWILCITDLDISSLPEEKLAIAGVITRKVFERLKTISFRTRISEEYAYYETGAWNRSRMEAARALAAKQEERSLLIYRGDPQWRYHRNLERLDAEIEKLALALKEVDDNAPAINREPVFNLTRGNLDYSFPAPPWTGTENKFCGDQKADAMLAGSVTDFHGRYVVSLKLYTVYTRSFVWEDSVIFSSDDLETALDEITQRLIILLSGNRPAVVTVRAQPEETLVLINRSFAGRGETSSLEYPPGRVTITASAPNHESISFETDLFSGEHTEIDISLRPIDYMNIEIDGITMAGNVYNGALYVGESPLTLRLPVNQMQYIELETPNSEVGTVVYQTPDNGNFNHSLFLRTAIPPEKGRVDRTRRTFYWVWGSTWITGIAAWVTYYSYVNSTMALNYQYSRTGVFDPEFRENNLRMYYINMGAVIAVSAMAAFDIFQMIRYIYVANKGSTPIVRTSRN